MTSSSTTAADPSARMAARPTAARLADVLWLALWGATVAALVHVGYTEFRFRVLHVFTWTSREFAWMALGGYLAYFLALALPLGALALVLRRGISLRVVASVNAALAAFAILLLYQRIHPLAQLALAIGLGVQVGGWIAREPAVGMRRVRIIALAGVLTLGAAGAATSAGQRFGEARRLAALPAPAADAPNIVLLILDTVRAANMSLYGYARPTTPVLDVLARESTVFDRAFSSAPWTAPSHASMMTGVWPSQAGADYLHPMYDSLPTVAERLAARGYASGGFMANTGYAGYQLGIARGFAHYEDFVVNMREVLWSSTFSQTGSGHLLVEGLLNGERWKLWNAITRPNLRTVTVRSADPITASDIARNFLAWREGIGQRPYFAMLNFMDAHAPYNPPDGFRTRFNDGKREIDRYDGGIAYEDSVIGTLVQALRERGELDRTVLIVTSDHGELWGEHELESHGNSLYLPLLHVPLLVRAPGRAPAGQRVASIVSLRDLAATIVDLAGAPAGTLPGTSLASAWSPDGSGALSPVIAEAAAVVNPSPRNLTRFGPIKASLDSSWHFIRYGNGTEQLFAWRTDSAELDDRSATAEGREAVERHRAAIARALGTTWPPPRARLH
ncbi:MAG: sulfatase [Gemmatimonadota bacterium]